MTVPNDTTYPTNATNKTWQAKKTVGDKMLTKTGLGAKLTTAETNWKAIPWKDLDIRSSTIGTVEAAEAAKKRAEAAMVHLKAALTAVTQAQDEARVTAATKGLSSGTKAAADAVVTALADARKRLALVSITEFDKKVTDLKAPLKVSKIRVSSGGKEVATASAATWDRKELKVTGITWKVGKADDYKGKTVTVYGETAGSDAHAEGISKIFQNDMKLETASGTTASFKS